jgi:GAF domain-containing protein
MNTVVNLIIRAFPNIYHAQIFLIDADDKYAVLRASTGEAGIKLLERGHRLGVGSVSVIGAVTSEGRTIIARDTAASTIHKRNEFLPDTRAELAIPLRVGDRIIGALDVQSRQDNSFSEDQVKLLETMADQIAISLDNARLYEESIRRLEQITQASREGTLKAWQDHMAGQRSKSVVVHAGIRTTTETTALRQAAIDQGMTIVGTQTERNTIPFAVPIELRGQVLGAVEWELPVNDYSYEKVLLAEELVSRLAISLDNARLFEQSQRAAERERIVNTIAAKITGHTNIDEILRTAIQEVGQALRVPEVNIRLGGITHEQ